MSRGHNAGAAAAGAALCKQRALSAPSALSAEERMLVERLMEQQEACAGMREGGDNTRVEEAISLQALGLHKVNIEVAFTTARAPGFGPCKRRSTSVDASRRTALHGAGASAPAIKGLPDLAVACAFDWEGASNFRQGIARLREEWRRRLHYAYSLPQASALCGDARRISSNSEDEYRRATAFFNVVAELERRPLPVPVSTVGDKNVTLLGGCTLRQSIAESTLAVGVAAAILAIHEPTLSISQTRLGQGSDLFYAP